MHVTIKRVLSVFFALGLLAAACASESSSTAPTVGGTSVPETPLADADVAEPVEDDAAVESEVEEQPVEEQVVEEEVVEEVPEASEPAVGTATREATFGEEFPDIIGVQATQEDAGSWRFDVTVSSPYDSPQRYADAWRVLDPDGNELGIRVLTHDHASEQPFTRSQGGIQVPDGVSEVTIQGRDLGNGWGGGELVVTLPVS